MLTPFARENRNFDGQWSSSKIKRLRDRRSVLLRGAGDVFGGGVENLRKRARGVNSIVLVQSQENLSRSLRARFPIEEIVQLWLATRTGPCVCWNRRERKKSLLNSRPVISTARAQNLQRDSRRSSSWSRGLSPFGFPLPVKAIGERGPRLRWASSLRQRTRSKPQRAHKKQQGR